MDCPTSPYMTPDSAMIDANVNLVDPPLDSTTRLSMLTTAEWATLCEWTTDLTPLDQYYCDDLIASPDACDGCFFVDRSLERCREIEAPYWQARTGDCPASVGDWLQCNRDRLYGFECVLDFPDSCQAIRLTCPPL